MIRIQIRHKMIGGGKRRFALGSLHNMALERCGVTSGHGVRKTIETQKSTNSMIAKKTICEMEVVDFRPGYS